MADDKVLVPRISGVKAKLHPLVLFSICDAYMRRNDDQERVIGTLMGTISADVIEIKSCFSVPHLESSEQVHAQWRFSYIFARIHSIERASTWKVDRFLKCTFKHMLK